VFKIKLKKLINDIHKKHILGCMIAGIYVVEFQKRGLPHAHILIFFTEDYKPHMVKDVVKLSIHPSRHPSMDGITATHVVKILLYA
jgi:hypothetical protein